MKTNPTAESTPLSARFRPDAQKRREYIPGQMIVKFHSGALHATVGTFNAGGAKLGARVTEALPASVSGPFDYLRTNVGLKRTTALFAQPEKSQLLGLNAAGLAAIRSVAASPHEDLEGYTVVEVPPTEVTAKLMKHLSQSRAIQYIEPMPARWIAAKRKPKKAGGDPMRRLQWALKAIGWDKITLPSAQKVKVAILDTGVDETHEDLKGIVEAYDHKGTSAEDLLGHGTHVAGVIAAVINNGIGISGVARCRLSVWKIFDDKPTDGDFYVNGELYLRALGLLDDHGCRVVNLSIGGTQQSRTEALLFTRLRERNVLPVAAMGNEYDEGNPIEFPAAYRGVIGVGAISSEFRRASFSNTGAHITLVAPGHTILSTVPMAASAYREEKEYASWSGTSMATPHVTAGAALYLARHRTASPAKVEAALKRGVKRLPRMGKKSFTPAYGTGLMYLPKLLKA